MVYLPQHRFGRCCGTLSGGQVALSPRGSVSRFRASSHGQETLKCSALYLGIDVGTSGTRAIAIDDQREQVAEVKRLYSSARCSDHWKRALSDVLEALPREVRRQLKGISVDGTSSTTLLCDGRTGEVLADPKMYYESQGQASVDFVANFAPASHTATASTSTLSKLVTWHLEGRWQQAKKEGRHPCLLHQADWISGQLHMHWDTTDWNNSLKLGFDPAEERFPPWLTSQDFAELLPQRLVAPGGVIGPVCSCVSQEYGISKDCQIVGGTTDSNAAFLAAGVQNHGEAVTSLGSSLAVKLLSKTRVDDAAFGVYSHKLGDSWLVGGASSSGGRVLKHFFTDEELKDLTERIDASKECGLDYYPLLTPGERLPVNDPHLQPRMEPRPEDDALFLHGLLEGMAKIEAASYHQLTKMGASTLTKVYTAGGGAKNTKWTEMRAKKLGVPVEVSKQGEAAYGAALLALQGASPQAIL